MREILFRAWDKAAGIMVYPVVVYSIQDHVGFDLNVFEKLYNEDNCGHLEWGDDWVYLFDCEVMQCTGLKDANGKEIFEGDVVTDEVGITLYEVVFYNGSFGCKAPWKSIWPMNAFGLGVTIKGNIYENPNLAPPNTGFQEQP